METKLIEIKVSLDESMMNLLKLKLSSVNTIDLCNVLSLIKDELKQRGSKFIE